MRALILLAIVLLPLLGLKTPAPAAGEHWNAADRGQKVGDLAPGRRIPTLTAETLYADWCKQQVTRWEKDHPALPPAEAYAKHAAASPTDAELRADFPRHIVPFARVRSGKADPAKTDAALATYCPLCGSWGFGLTYDGWYHATTNCCKAELWGREQDMPANYALRPTEKIAFQHLDDTMYEAPGTVFRDQEGVEWELFIRAMMDYRRWLQQDCDLVRRFGLAFMESADPLYAHKIAIILDQVADTYYGLPLAKGNTLATYEGKPLTRAAWLTVPKPGIFETTPLGAWGRRIPFSSPGWLNMLDEHIWVEPFGRVRHHPAFKAVSQKLYGDPEALDRKIMTKLIADLVLMFKTAFSQKLLTNYQEANYVDMWLLGILAGDKTLLDFAGPAQEVAMYNHTYQDGLNGEGAPNYMAMPGGYFYPFLADPKGWLQYYPKFLEDHPFYFAANAELRKLTTVRGLQVEFGDQHELAFPSLLVTPAAVRAAERIGSRNWAGYGVGIMRIGGPGHRQEMCLTYTRASLHNAQDALGLDCWVDGIPVLRRGGYSAYWSNARLQWDRPEFQALRQMDYPKEIAEGGWPPDNWSWNYSHSPLCQGNLTIDEVGVGAGWDDNRGYGEVITYKGGEAAGEPGSGFQVIDVLDHYSWARRDKKIEDFRRCVIGVEGPDGRPYAVDLLTCEGEGRQALYQSAFADPVEEQLPPVKGQAESLKTLYFGDQKVDDSPENQAFAHTREVKTLAAPDKPWSVTWKNDLGLYGPRDPGGKPYQRPWPGDVGKVRMRLIGLPQTGGGQTDLVRAKGPWIGWLRQPLPGGAKADGNVAFMDARDFVIERRLPAQGPAEARPLRVDSLYVRIMEGYREGEQSVIKSVTRLQATDAGPANSRPLQRKLVALKIEFIDGHTDTVIHQSEAGKVKLPDGTETDARYALLRQDKAGKVTGSEVVRGTYLRAGAFGVNLTGEFGGEIVDVIGDLTGTRQESALIVKPDKPWPVGTDLHDRQLLVRYESELRHPGNEGWRVDKVTALPGGLVRVDVQDHAPFIVSWHQVTVLPTDQPNVIKTWRPMVDHGNNPWYNGLKLWFPERGKLYTIKNVNRVGGGYGGDTVELVEQVDLAAEGLKVGDWYVIYGVQPGLRVNVANDFSFRQEPAQGWTQYGMRATGAFTLKAPETAGALSYRAGGGDWQTATQGKQSFTAEETQGQTVRLLVGKPAWLNLNDPDAPAVALTLDGRELAAEQARDQGWIDAPKVLVVTFKDAANPLNVGGVQATFNGRRLDGGPADSRPLLKATAADGDKTLRVEINLQQALGAEMESRKHLVEVTVADKSVDRRATTATLSFMVRVPLEADAIYLSDLKPVKSFAHGGLMNDRDYIGNPAQIAGRLYPKCITLCPEPSAEGEHGQAVYAVPGDKGELTLVAEVGISSSAAGSGSVEFLVQVGDTADGEWTTLFRSPVLRGGMEPIAINLPLQGAKFVRLYTTSAGDGINSDHALWGSVRFKAVK
jgi:hypothetical protein